MQSSKDVLAPDLLMSKLSGRPLGLPSVPGGGGGALSYADYVAQQGGTIQDSNWVDTWRTLLQNQGLWNDVVFSFDANFGYKLDGSSNVVSLYELRHQVEMVFVHDTNPPDYNATSHNSRGSIKFNTDGSYGELDISGSPDVLALYQNNKFTVFDIEAHATTSRATIAFTGDKSNSRNRIDSRVNSNNFDGASANDMRTLLRDTNNNILRAHFANALLTQTLPTIRQIIDWDADGDSNTLTLNRNGASIPPSYNEQASPAALSDTGNLVLWFNHTSAGMEHNRYHYTLISKILSTAQRDALRTELNTYYAVY